MTEDILNDFTLKSDAYIRRTLLIIWQNNNDNSKICFLYTKTSVYAMIV